MFEATLCFEVLVLMQSYRFWLPNNLFRSQRSTVTVDRGRDVTPSRGSFSPAEYTLIHREVVAGGWEGGSYAAAVTATGGRLLQGREGHSDETSPLAFTYYPSSFTYLRSPPGQCGFLRFMCRQRNVLCPTMSNIRSLLDTTHANHKLAF